MLELLDREYFRGGLQLGPQRLLVPLPVRPGFSAHNQLTDQLRQLLRRSNTDVFPVVVPPSDQGTKQQAPTQQAHSNLWIRARTDTHFSLIDGSHTIIWEGIQFELTPTSQPQWAGICVPDHGIPGPICGDEQAPGEEPEDPAWDDQDWG
ncbi:hypothetical protein [Deinococcus sp. SL84]|uniref:hypothetical protein n=1 Tax=Deinococcus sp. SL84 TaxID=2994663 RepID=UPI00227233BC|nr:hypothetical protein [Deinococcus sp. SL84]MCY1703819.1 hypothetical protein [Deinococcus sp. SL84]